LAQNGNAQNAAKAKSFSSAQEAADALISAAEKYDETALAEILGPDSYDIIHTGEPARDREVAQKFAEQARVKTNVSLQPKNPRRAILQIGDDDWPFAVPIVKVGSSWSFDTKAGRQELLYRRVGSNELDAIAVCRGYVEAQHEYALQKRGTSGVNQYAQRIISTPGTQDGLAWKNEDGTWGGPIGEKVAAAIARGYSNRSEPFHGYFFKILKGQGPRGQGRDDRRLCVDCFSGAVPSDRRANLHGEPRRRCLPKGPWTKDIRTCERDRALQSGQVLDACDRSVVTEPSTDYADDQSA
jgi:hypothetical protein